MDDDIGILSYVKKDATEEKFVNEKSDEETECWEINSDLIKMLNTDA